MSPLARNLTRVLALVSASPLLLSAQGMHVGFDDRLLAGHNRARLAMGMAPMQWDNRLARDAQVWANKLASTGQFYHSPDVPGKPLEGENLWAGTTGAFTPEDMVGLWLKEKRFFRHGSFPNNSTTGNILDVAHYTQVIWHDTRKVGCALAHGDGEDVLVCRYSTYGNVVGDNPLKPNPALQRLDFAPSLQVAAGNDDDLGSISFTPAVIEPFRIALPETQLKLDESDYTPLFATQPVQVGKVTISPFDLPQID
ncbi:CAP domain-containing protein [Qipengyuania algicida]|nr:CAP domain-containing protein [Qipengyuania algicida]